VIQLSLFDRLDIGEFADPDNPEKRYCVCKNEMKAEYDQKTLETLLKNTSDDLEKIAAYTQATTPEILGARIGKILTKWGTGKYISWQIKRTRENKSNKHKVIWSLNQTAIEDSNRLAGCYAIVSNVENMTCADIVKSYKSLMTVERAFRNLKTVRLEIRPVYHKRDSRIKAHVFLCMLAYYVQWHMQQKLAPLSQAGKIGQWTFDQAIETMKCLSKNIAIIGGAEITKISDPTPDQTVILNLLEVSI
jgi:transposase